MQTIQDYSPFHRNRAGAMLVRGGGVTKITDRRVGDCFKIIIPRASGVWRRTEYCCLPNGNNTVVSILELKQTLPVLQLPSDQADLTPNVLVNDWSTQGWGKCSLCSMLEEQFSFAPKFLDLSPRRNEEIAGGVKAPLACIPEPEEGLR